VIDDTIPRGCDTYIEAVVRVKCGLRILLEELRDRCAELDRVMALVVENERVRCRWGQPPE